MVIDIEDTLITKIKIESELELREIRKSANYQNSYIEVTGGALVQVYMIRPYTLEFLRAIFPYFEIIVYSRMRIKISLQIVDHLEMILNKTVKEYFQS